MFIRDDVYTFFKGMLEGINYFFVIYMVIYSVFLFVSVVSGSVKLYHKRKQEKFKNTIHQNYYIPVSIIVPAYNEEVTVVETVKSLLALDYKLYEIIVVDDGSRDETSRKLIEAFDMRQSERPIPKKISCQREEAVYETSDLKVPLTLVRKINGGKADALNMGINISRYPYFICMDADSVLQYDSLSKIVVPVIEEENVVAVGGVVRPCNGIKIENGRVKNYHLPDNIIAAMQVLEYDRSFLASRILFDKFNASLLISGAFGLFKKDVVTAAGGYDSKTMGEDMELVVKLHEYCILNNMDYRIRYATDAVCWSQAPESLRDLRKQRKRWHIGLFQTLAKHIEMLLNPRFGAIALSYLYFFVFEFLSPFIEVFGLISMFIAWAIDLINVPFMIVFLIVYTGFGCVLTLTAFFARVQISDLRISSGDVLKAIMLCFFEIGGLRFVMAFVRATALIGYNKKKLSWGRIERKKMDIK